MLHPTMGKRNHFIIIGRTSQAIAQAIVDQFGDGARGESGPMIDRPGPIIQARFGTHKDSEPTANLFVDGKLSDHPIEQNLSHAEKKQMVGALKGANVTIVHSMSGTNASSRMQSALFMADYLTTRLGVNKIRFIGTYIAGMRNDRSFEKELEDGTISAEYNAISCGSYAKQLKFSGVHSVYGFEAHSKQGVGLFRNVFGDNHVRFVNLGSFFAQTIKNQFDVVANNQPRLIIGSPDGMNKPDDYGIARAMALAEKIYHGTVFASGPHKDGPTTFAIHKVRGLDGKPEIADFRGNVENKICVINDDIIGSGGTIFEAAKALRERGASEILAIGAHGVLVGDALPKLVNSDLIDHLYLTDTIPGIADKVERFGLTDNPKLVINTVAPLVCETISSYFPRENNLPFAAPRLQAG